MTMTMTAPWFHGDSAKGAQRSLKIRAAVVVVHGDRQGQSFAYFEIGGADGFARIAGIVAMVQNHFESIVFWYVTKDDGTLAVQLVSGCRL